MRVRSRVKRLGWACAAIVLLVGCAREGGHAAANAPAPAANAATLAAAPPPAPANTAQNDLFQIDTNAAANATNTVDPVEAGLLAAKNTECVDQLIRSQPFGESESQIIDNVTKACLPIAQWAAQSQPKPPASIEATERNFVTAQVHELADATSASPPDAKAPPAANASASDAKPPPPAPARN